MYRQQNKMTVVRGRPLGKTWYMYNQIYSNSEQFGMGGGKVSPPETSIQSTCTLTLPPPPPPPCPIGAPRSYVVYTVL